MLGINKGVYSRRHMRQREKIAQSALGYQGGVGALKTMSALDQGISENDLQDIVDSWCGTNKKINRFWFWLTHQKQ
ncbi:hypothetical protein P7D85_11035 [Enterococcus hulanensis]|uniref:Uncharacterized protein n=1 Tax=Enterococcus hulanensis TaxID=2559929 RepID=A0ABU3EZL0_9ENTE|nr:hypothetical protein [Enterococcus hulanensis]MDT2600311.1 hypothetical protein [Enterococcus hulanensis]MDT2609124.1 hypothetical protein [Enterococcus hulanensis]MDT2616834.1 hypothetical protein [Enterococcus hulanensis]MDT2628646.1 hypothetical protein [Enterococcus hulanensis]MDT2655986.1 hypothetical protein [Enterococcus hulanensis]